MADIVITAANVTPGTNAIISNGRAGATVAQGKVGYFDTADEKWKLADSNSATAAAKLPPGTKGGIFLNAGSDGQPIAVLTEGQINLGAVLTAGIPYFLSDTAGGICPLADVGSGEGSVFLGMALTTSILDVTFRSSGVTF